MTSSPLEIFVRDLAIDMFIGVLESEKTSKQRVIVNMKAHYNRPGEALYDDAIETTLSYVDLIAIAEKTAQKRHFNLVETLAEEIADACLKIEGLEKIRVEIEKPDIIKNAASVGVSIVRP